MVPRLGARVERRGSGSGPDGHDLAAKVMTWRRSPRPIGFALERAREQWEPETLLAEVQRVWGDAVGPAISTEARPASVRAGVLTVSCSASVWAQELDLMAEAILGPLNTRLRSGRIDRLRCVTVPLSDDGRSC